MPKILKLILPIIFCIVGLCIVVKQIYLISYLKKNGVHSVGKVYDLCKPNCILIDLNDSQVTHSGLRIGSFFPLNYKSGDLVDVIYDKNDKNKIIVDDAFQSVYFPYGVLFFLLIILILLIH